jgi:molybdopterin molybdotransferase
MAQLSDDCFAFGGALLPLEEARARIAELHDCVAGVALLPLAEAVGRVLAADVHAAIDVPPHTNSAVDGYALTHADLRSDAPTLLPLTGRTVAGHAPEGPVPRGYASRIFTGAVLPEGPDTVMMQEDCTLEDGGVLVKPGIRRGANRRLAGEDIARGALALAAGRWLQPPDIGLLAAFGTQKVAVRSPLRVALFSTGDEIVDPPASLAVGKVYDANRFMLAALLRRLGAEVLDGGILPDNREETSRALARAALGADLLLTSGGVSTGEEDHVRAAIEDAGTIAFWRVAIKPGRPVALGQVGGTPLLGLPGNPVAALVTFIALGRPLFDRLSGATYVPPPRFAVQSGFAYRKKAGRREYVRVQIGADGVALRYPKEGAGIITSLTESDALMELPEDMTALSPGDVAPCIPMGLLHG